MPAFFNVSLRSTILYLLIIMSPVNLFSREPDGTIRGIITDRSTRLPLVGASVLVTETDPPEGALTDSTGFFVLSNVRPGRHSLKITHVGYQDQVLYDLLVTSGKELVIETGLTPKTTVLREVRIRGNTGIDQTDIPNLGSRIISIEETMRYAATFNDPVRVTASYPGITITNDQANHAVIRGNSPAGILWKIEGIDVVNPNHLTNAGTPSDRPSVTGGGVAIISSQLLSESIFLSGAFPAGYGNVLSGVFDYRLRKGNNREFEFTGQAGLLGLDFSAEGPFSNNYDGSFLVNFRYSTIGLFELAGIPIGDEKINFRDLAFKISLPSDKAGDFSIFALGGKSITAFTAQRDSSKWLFAKDRTDYEFYSDMGAAGITHLIKPGQNSRFQTSLAVSYLKSGRDELLANPGYTFSFNGSDRLDAGKISFSSYYHGSVGKNSLKAGVALNRDNYAFGFKPGISGNGNTEVDKRAAYITVQPYIQWKRQSGKISLDPGIHFLYTDFNGNWSAEPRISATWQLLQRTSVTAGYGLQSMMQHPSVYFNSVEENRNLHLTKAHHYTLGFTGWLREDMALRAELYLQRLFNVPVSRDTPTSFSAINLNETIIINEPLINKGTGENYGIELSLERSIRKGLYYIIAGSLYNSRYEGSDEVRRNTRFNGRYQGKMTSGKEFVFNRTKGINTLGINISGVLAGGMRYTPVDTELSAITGETVCDAARSFSEKSSDYFRLDTRLYWRKDRHGHTETFALDIQNATNRKNTAWIYYDALRRSVMIKEQLGLLPFFSYRIEF